MLVFTWKGYAVELITIMSAERSTPPDVRYVIYDSEGREAASCDTVGEVDVWLAENAGRRKPPDP